MADCGESRSAESNLRSSYQKSSLIRKSRRAVRNSCRRYRRKRSKLRYYTSLKQLRCRRKTDDLCSAVEVFDIADMECAASRVTNTSIEVADWHKQEQVAYWKSRALSLEHENRMLLQHLRNVYAKQTEDYANQLKRQEIEEKPAHHRHVEAEETDGEVEDLSKPPEEPVGVKRREEMGRLYGKEAARIMGMEACVKLNYELNVDQANPPFWPYTPLNLRFD